MPQKFQVFECNNTSKEVWPSGTSENTVTRLMLGPQSLTIPGMEVHEQHDHICIQEMQNLQNVYI